MHFPTYLPTNAILFHNSFHFPNSSLTRRNFHCSSEKRGRALSHLDEHGTALMVDITSKPATLRVATASATIEYPPKAFEKIFSAGSTTISTPKGDIFGVARIAGIQAAKSTADLIPLCHQLALSHIDIYFCVEKATCCVKIFARVKCTHGSGVEMEALTACTIAALTLYDMCKALSSAIRITNVHLIEKSGGKSSTFGNIN